MNWLQRYHFRSVWKRSLWLLPSLAIIVALWIMPMVRWIDSVTLWSWLNLTPEGAKSILGAFSASMLTFVVFIVSSVLIVVQLATAQLTPRVIAWIFASHAIKWVLAIYTFAYTFTLAVASRIDNVVPQFPVAVAILLNLFCIAIFFWFVQHLGGALRPIAILVAVARDGMKVVESVYPDAYVHAEMETPRPATPNGDRKVITHGASSGVVMAFSHKDLLILAERANATIELVPQVGDFLAKGDPLFRISPAHASMNERELLSCVAIGPERTMEHDPRFAFRIMVDIANKALSPAINDPTTAVLALDQLHRLLNYVGRRRLDAGQMLDSRGQLRVQYGTPDWADFVNLAVTEIRHYGAGSMQVVRRLRAMLDHLLRVLPESRHAALKQELTLLQSSTQRLFHDEVDRNTAAIGDLQGLGGSDAVS